MDRREWVVVVVGLIGTFTLPWPVAEHSGSALPALAEEAAFVAPIGAHVQASPQKRLDGNASRWSGSRAHQAGRCDHHGGGALFATRSNR